MIKLIYVILDVVIKDIEVRCSNANLLVKKSSIWFELLAEKGDTGKQTANAL